MRAVVRRSQLRGGSGLRFVVWELCGAGNVPVGSLYVRSDLRRSQLRQRPDVRAIVRNVRVGRVLQWQRAMHVSAQLFGEDLRRRRLRWQLRNVRAR
jgi:hypothetical protein